MEGFIAVVGFWTFMLAIVLRKPITEVMMRSRVNNQEVTLLKAQIEQMQNALDSMNREVLELKETSDFQQKLLTDRARAAKPTDPRTISLKR
jgi:hypothetical protein